MSEISARRDLSTPRPGSAADLDLTSEEAAALKQSATDAGASESHPRRIAQAVLSIVSELGEEGRKKIENEHSLFHSPLTHGEGDQPLIPAPGKPLDAAALIATLANLMASQQQETASMVSTQIKSSNVDAQVKGKEQMAKIQDSINKMAEAHKDGGWLSVFSWVCTIATVVIAAAATVATGGAAAPLLAAAVLGLAVKIAQETGLMDKLTDALADMLVNTFHCSPELAKTIAGIVIAVAVIAAQIAIVVGSGGAGALGAASAGLRAAQLATAGVTLTGTVTTQVVNIVAAGKEKDAENLKADAKVIGAMLAKISATMEQQQDDLKAIVKNMQVYYGFAADALRNQSATQHAISEHMSANA